MTKKLVITIDGPAGAGKSTVSKALAAKLSYLYLDTGALYRAIAYQVKQEGIAPTDEARLSELSRTVNICLKNVDGQMRIFLKGEDVTDKIRTEEISMLASTVSARPCVREALLHLQREAGARGGIVAEGRDMATVVFPQADYQFYLDASVAARAKRRYGELMARNGQANFAEIEKDIIVRDKQDRERAIAPLKPAPRAVLIDSTSMTVREVVERIAACIGSPEQELAIP